MKSSLSKGDFLGDRRHCLHRFNFLRRRLFPTDENLCFDTRTLIGGFCLSILNGSCLSPVSTGVNRLPKPPWKLLYNLSSNLPSLFSLYPIKSDRYPTTNMSDFLRKSVQDLDLGIDDDPITLSPEFVSQAASVNRYSLIVTTVNPRKQNLRALIGQMPRVWGLTDSCVGRIMGQGKVQFKFKTEESMNLVLSRGPWSFNDWMLSIHRWYPNITEGKMKIIPFWVQIQGIPILYLTNAMARAVGNRLGHVKLVDFDENANQVGFVRVKIDWNVDDPLRFQRNFQFTAGENTIIKFRFERLRNFCTKCGSLKHDIKECSLVFDDANPAGPDDGNDEDGHNDDHDDNAMSDDDTLPSIDPATLIPGLQRHTAMTHNGESSSASKPSDIPSAFEDTELTAERLRYLHAKHVRESLMKAREEGQFEEVADNAMDEFVFMKRKRVSFETRYNQAEADEESAILSHFRKKEKKGEASAPYATTFSLDGGAGGPVPPYPP
ncbi:unnamed protein product [Arabidopsis halleri]